MSIPSPTSATLFVPPVLGTVEYYARYQPGGGTGLDVSYSDHVFVTRTPASSSVTLTAPLTVELHDTLTLQGQVYSSQFDIGGTLKFFQTGNPTPLCTQVRASQDTGFCTVTPTVTGAAHYYATYSGTASVLASQSSTIDVTVTSNTVRASGVGTQYTTFYPITDAYRDTVAVRGTRDEAASVSIKIYSPGGTLLKSVSIASATGAYSYAWNGRNSSGTIYAEGSYKVVQALKDVWGTTRTFTNYVALSKKKIYLYTKTITKLGSSLTAKGSGSGGAVSVNTTYGYAKLYAPTIYTSWAGVGWELTIPSATVYKWMYVKVYGRHSGIGGETRVGAQNFSTCAYATAATWYDSCFASWKTIDSTSGTTLYSYRTPGLSSSYRSGTKVRVLVTSTGGTTYIYKAQVVVQYGIFKY